jgi:ankyrin repeat protein
LNEHLNVCYLLLDWGAKVDPLDKCKYTWLFGAEMNGDLSVAELLVERGANVSLKNGNGQTASDVARSEGYSDMADWLNTNVYVTKVMCL